MQYQHEYDCPMVVTQLQMPEASSSFMGNLFQDIKNLMTRFQHGSIQFKVRQCNVAAHKLAIYAWNVYNILLWYGDALDFLSHTC